MLHDPVEKPCFNTSLGMRSLDQKYGRLEAAKILVHKSAWSDYWVNVQITTGPSHRGKHLELRFFGRGGP